MLEPEVIQTNLFIGGPWDGRRTPVWKFQNYVEVPVIPPQPLSILDTAPLPIRLDLVGYRRERLGIPSSDGPKAMEFWVDDRLTLLEAFEMLFAHYRP